MVSRQGPLIKKARFSLYKKAARDKQNARISLTFWPCGSMVSLRNIHENWAVGHNLSCCGLFRPAQTVATTANVLHPIMKDIHKPMAPTSLNQDPKRCCRIPNRPISPVCATVSRRHAPKPRDHCPDRRQPWRRLPNQPLANARSARIKAGSTITNIGSQVVVARRRKFAVARPEKGL